jgi:hypothetical protein
LIIFLGPDEVLVNYNERLDPEAEAYTNAWALVDSNDSVVQPRGELVSIGSKIFVVQATSPKPKRWKEWSKQRNGRIVVMKGWLWAEFFIGGSVLAYRSFTSFFTHQVLQD